ncbi:MAG TPA: hypothetical protein VK966_12320 [Longimicrobiales bacterium]|nr:hypothetical protein [Longimicrobiales bacterium]
MDNPTEGQEPLEREHTSTASTASPGRSTEKRRGRGILWAALAVLVAFAVGFGWQYYRASTIQDSLEETEQELAMERLRLGLAQATLAAQSGDYELARQQMSDFFNDAQSQMGMFPPELQQALREILTQRDDVITGLSRSNHEYGGVLHGFLDRLRVTTDAGPATPSADDSLPPGLP